VLVNDGKNPRMKLIRFAASSLDAPFTGFRSRQAGRKSSSCPIGRHITNARGVARSLAPDQPFSPFNYYLITLIARRERERERERGGESPGLLRFASRRLRGTAIVKPE